MLLLGGLCLPAFVGQGGQTLVDVGINYDGLPLDAVIILVLAFASLLLALMDRCVLPWLTGIGCQMALASTYLLWEAPVGPPLGAQFCFDMPRIGLLPGWWLMELGLLLLLVAAALGDLLACRQVQPAPLHSFLGPAENWRFYELE